MRTVEELESEVAKLKAECARAELRARDAVAAVKQVVAAHDARETRHDGIYSVDWASTPDAHAVGQAFATALHVLVMESTAPDSDARLREVMAKQLEAENAELRAEIERLNDPLLKQVTIEPGAMEMTLDGATATMKRMAIAMVTFLEGHGAKNYVQQEISLGTNDFVMLVQRRSGKTPHQLRQEAEAKVARLNAVLQHTHTIHCTESWTSRGKHAPECLASEVES